MGKQERWMVQGDIRLFEQTGVGYEYRVIIKSRASVQEISTDTPQNNLLTACKLKAILPTLINRQKKYSSSL